MTTVPDKNIHCVSVEVSSSSSRRRRRRRLLSKPWHDKERR